jgi:hypothetical protein
MMTDNTVVPFAQPDIAAMAVQLEHQFGGFLDGAHNGLIELAWTNADDGKLRHAEMFHTDDLDKIAQRAFEINSIPGQNVYIGAALRKPGTFPGGRAEDEDYFATTASYVDLDDEGAADAVTGKYRGCKPTLAVVTGRQPYKRVQLWWRLETPERDPDAHRAQCLALAIELGGDRTVVNPSRVMRLGGSIAWPRKAGRVIEKTEVICFSDGRPLVMMPGQLAKAFPPMYAAPAQPPATAIQDGRSPITGKVNAAAMIARIQSGSGQWHNNVRDLVAHWVMRGLSDAEIINQAAGLTLSGYTVQQTVDEMTVALRGARTKWNRPNVETEFDPETGEILPPFVPADDDGPFFACDLRGKAPEREWVIDQWLPARATTALYGDGGTNKTTLALQLAAAVSTGGEWLGHSAAKGRALCILCEDDRDELHRRQDSIDAANGTVLRSQLTDLALWPRVGKDTVLQTFSRDNVSELTTFYHRLDQAMEAIKPSLLVLDTAADLFGGNENVRSHVNQFVKFGLGSLILKYQTTILLLAHPSMAGLASGSGAGGSTGWNNSVRSRWYLQAAEGDPNARILTRKKSNYAAAGDDQKIDLIWEAGVLRVAEKADGGEVMGGNKAVEILKEVHAAFDRGNPFGAHEKSERPLVNWIVNAHGIKREEARKWIMDWLSNEVLTSERCGRNTSRKGLKVTKWPGQAGEI